MNLLKLHYLRIVHHAIKCAFNNNRYKVSSHFLLQMNQNICKYGQPFKWLSVFIVACAALPDDKKKTVLKLKKSLLDEADELFNTNKYTEVYELLKSWKDNEDVEVLWRISRALYKRSQQEEHKQNQRDMIVEGYELLKLALALDDNNFAVHKWYSILLDAYAAYNGVKARLSELETVKKHMMRAIELNDKDATTLYILGQWCFGIADLSWYQRKIASLLFTTPPTSSYEEALTYFVKAEEVAPNFYSLNLLMLGKTYLRLKKHDKARHYLSLAAAYPAKTDEDVQTKKEAEEILMKVSH